MPMSFLMSTHECFYLELWVRLVDTNRFQKSAVLDAPQNVTTHLKRVSGLGELLSERSRAGGAKKVDETTDEKTSPRVTLVDSRKKGSAAGRKVILERS